jgi:hypothetical protein
MRVRMKMEVSGARNGVAWPKRGETFDVSDSEGADLCASGLAEPVADSDGDVEKAVPAEDAEERALTTENSAAVTPGASEEKPSASAKKTAAKRAPAKPAEGK